MDESSNSKLKSINDLKKFSFYVPFYQRGYRWTGDEITSLLEDVAAWDGPNPYFLQLLVVRKDGMKYNIVDGQQRLTTVALILEKLDSCEGYFSIDYARGSEGSADARFRKNAKEIIADWMQKCSKREALRDNFLNAQFLYYEASDEQEEKRLFHQLNTWRIPATDAELVKCIILSRGDAGALEGRTWEWDTMERSLRDDMFWGMLGLSAESKTLRMEIFLANIPFVQKRMEEDKANIERFPIFAQIQKIEKCDLEEWWKEVVMYWKSCLRDHGDILRHNYVGWRNLCRQSGYCNAPQCLEIKNELMEKADLYEENVCWARSWLLLANAAFAWTHGRRYDFYGQAQRRAISVEHIRARNQHKLDSDELKRWLEEKKVSESKRAEIINRYVCVQDVVKAEDELAKSLADIKVPYFEKSVDHSIGNLALLTNEANAAFNNGTFEEKRFKLVKRLSEGDFVPDLTQAVFFRTLPGVGNGAVWVETDREVYKDFMKNIVRVFLEAVRQDGIDKQEAQA